MPRGSKTKYSSKQKRQAEHIEKSYEKKGSSPKRAERIAWTVVNKSTGGGKKKGGSGRGKKKTPPSTRKGGKSRGKKKGKK